MSFHPDKCEVLHVTQKRTPLNLKYTLHGNTLNTVNKTKYLGVTISQDMKWKDQINNTCNKANQTLGFVRRNLKNCPKQAKETTYKSLVHPQLEYCSSVWDPYQQIYINKIEMTQRRAARFIQNNYSRQASVTEMMNSMGWEPLQHRRIEGRLTMMYKITYQLVAIPILPLLQAPQRLTRRNHIHTYLHHPTSSDLYKYAFIPWTITQWNQLPQVVAEAPTLEAFKVGLQQVPMAPFTH